MIEKPPVNTLEQIVHMFQKIQIALFLERPTRKTMESQLEPVNTALENASSPDHPRQNTSANPEDEASTRQKWHQPSTTHAPIGLNRRTLIPENQTIEDVRPQDRKILSQEGPEIEDIEVSPPVKEPQIDRLPLLLDSQGVEETPTSPFDQGGKDRPGQGADRLW